MLHNSLIVYESAIIRVYYEDRINSIESILKKPRGKFSEKDFHNLRVEIKKVNAVSELVYHCSVDFQKEKFLKSFQNVFRKAGKVRVLTLEISMLKKLRVSSLLKKYVTRLKKRLEKRKDSFFSVVRGTRGKLHKRYGIILPFFNRIDKTEVNRFFEMKRREINELIGNKVLKVENAHQLRKLLKEFYYTASIFELKSPWFKEMDHFQELLGNWHDDDVMAEYLQKKLETGRPNNKEVNSIKTVKQLVSYEGQQLFKQINVRIGVFHQPKEPLGIRL